MSQIFVLLQIAFRNLFASFLNVIIGALILVGTLLVVIGGALLDSMDAAMSKSIVGSVSGDMQVYQRPCSDFPKGQEPGNCSKEELAVFGSFGGFPDVAPIPDFSKIKTSVVKNPNVKAIVPMGINGALVTAGNTVDLTLERLRNVEKQRLAGDNSPDTLAKIDALKQHVHHILSVLKTDMQKVQVLASEVDPANLAAIDKANSEAFWADFDQDPLDHLEFLENKIAPIVPDADLRWLSYIGTDLDAFEKSFDRMEIVDGQRVPTGHRGLLMAKFRYEEDYKLKNARRLDKINMALHDEGKRIKDDPDLKQLAKQNQTQTRDFILQLDPITAKQATERLQKELNSTETDLAKLLYAFFDTTDENFDQRYKFFYDQLAPLVELYRLRVGDTLTIKAFTNSGYVKSINVKVYGTFNFKGLEKSGLAGQLNLMDLASFRDLYGYLSADKLAEIKQISKAAGVQMVDRDKAESELFGGGNMVNEEKQTEINENAEMGGAKRPTETEQEAHVYTQDEIDHGVVLNAAVMLKDPSQLDKTMTEIEQQAKADGLNLASMSWQKAAGFIGQFAFLAKVVLYVFVLVIFVVTLVVINLALMMATMQRIREIGTMRAIGAQRAFVLSMVLIETICLGLVFGTVGALAGSGVVGLLGSKGIPAFNEWLYFFFSGPRLFPGLHAGNLIAAFVIILLVTCISTLYPALIATRVSPVEAMASDE
jgi:ABC-type lipoprotein release transport system permease subunit